MALCYPDLYEIGFGNLALQILYETINEEEDFWAERVFAPAPDFEEFLRTNNLPLYTLESFSPLSDMDLIGITLPYEMIYTNILNVLDLGGIAIYSKDRKEEDPFILGGGPAMANPEPIADFFDLFVLGDGERADLEVLRLVKEGREKGLKRVEILQNLSKIKGVYVPCLYPLEYEENGFYLKEKPGFCIEKRVEKDLNELAIPVKTPIPWCRVVHDKGTLELFRGCYHRCRFCQAGSFYKPVRERSPYKIQEAVRKIFYNQGIREYSLMSLSSGDYSRLMPLMQKLNEEWRANFVSFFLPSLKINTFDLDLFKELNVVRKSGLTLAVEAGDDELRKTINKDVSDEKLIEIVKNATALGWRKMKLYFMLGMTDDIEREKNSIINLLNKLCSVNRKISFNVSVNLFIPKALTAFQWRKIYRAEVAQKAFSELAFAFKPNRKVKLRYQSPEMVHLEGVLARGSRKLSALIKEAFDRGCRLDGWDEYLKTDVYKELLEEYKDTFDYSLFFENLDENKILPWSFLDVRTSSSFFEKEKERSLLPEASDNCMEDCKDFCGACDSELKNVKAKDIFSEEQKVPSFFKTSKDYKGTVALIFEKRGAFRFLSQLELLSLWEKILIKSKIPFLFSEGFNPHPRLEFGFTAPVGVSSDYENVRFMLGEELTEEEVLNALKKAAPNVNFKNLIIYKTRPKSLQSITYFQDLSIKKLVIKDEKLLSLMKEATILSEDDDKYIIRLSMANKLKDWVDFCDIYKIERLKLLTKDQEEVL